jgi:predicted AAA+ superfamily ATPase
MAPEVIARALEPRVLEALEDTRVLTLDDAGTRDAAVADPTGFIADHEVPTVIDEVQRALDLLLAIKARVDRDPRPGQYLLTGSANILTAPTIADALAGRTEYLRLGPFAQSELRGAGGSFVSDILDGRWPRAQGQGVGRSAYAGIVAAGGYPEARERSGVRRARFFSSYLDSVIERDLSSIAHVHDQANVRQLMLAAAAVSTSLLNIDGLARDLKLPASTVRAHLALLENVVSGRAAARLKHEPPQPDDQILRGADQRHVGIGADLVKVGRSLLDYTAMSRARSDRAGGA